jgi:hypothetical protein
MVIERDRYLDDSGDWLVTLALRSRSPSTHSLLSGLTASEKEHVGRALAAALDEIVVVLASKRQAEAAR